MKLFVSTIFLGLLLPLISLAQNNFDFPVDSITQKYTLSQIINLSGKSKSEIFQAFKTVSKQFTHGNSDKLSSDEITKTIYLNSVYDPVTDSSRMVFKLILLQVSTKNFKVLGYKSYNTLTMDMLVYVKDGKYKMELTNYNVIGLDINHHGTMETIEKRNFNDKKWNKLKKEIYDDSEKSKKIVNDFIATYFKKSDF